MFEEAISFNAPISNWNVSQCQDFSSMFYKSNSFNQDLNWHMHNARDIRYPSTIAVGESLATLLFILLEFLLWYLTLCLSIFL